MSTNMFAAAFAAARRTRLVSLLACSALLGTLLPAFALYGRMGALKTSAASESILANRDASAGLYGVDVMAQFFAPPPTSWFLLGLLVSSLVYVFFSGGVIAAVARGRRSAAELASDSVSLFGHQLKQELLFLLYFVPLVLIVLGSAAAASDKSPVGALLILLLASPLLALLRTATDAARTAPMVRPGLSALRAWRFGWRVVRGSWLRAIAASWLPLVLSAAVMLLLTALEISIDATSSLKIVLVLAIALSAAWLRSAIRVGQWGAIVTLARERVRVDDEIEAARERELARLAEERRLAEEARRLGEERLEEERRLAAEAEATEEESAQRDDEGDAIT